MRLNRAKTRRKGKGEEDEEKEWRTTTKENGGRRAREGAKMDEDKVNITMRIKKNDVVKII